MSPWAPRRTVGASPDPPRARASSCMVVPVVPKPGRGQQRPGTQQPELDGTSVFAWIRGREAGGSV